MTDTTKHPAKYNPPVLQAIEAVVRTEADRLQRQLMVFDPFAGVGTLAATADAEDWPCQVSGTELEPEWAAQHPSTKCRDATRLPPSWHQRYDLVATSPCYGNRLADTYDGAGRCTKCLGTGMKGTEPHPAQWCERCEGTGTDQSRRVTYRLALGRELTQGSAAGMQWGAAYRRLHDLAWAEADRVLAPGGLVAINCKNHVRNGALQRVTEWHLNWWLMRGYTIEKVAFVAVGRGMGMGQNHEARADGERLLVLRKPDADPNGMEPML